MNDITRAIIDIINTFPKKLKLKSCEIHGEYTKLNFLSYNTFSSLTKALCDKKYNHYNGLLRSNESLPIDYIEFPYEVIISFSIPSIVFKDINWNEIGEEK